MIKEIKNKKGMSLKVIIRYKGVFVTKTFPIKGNRKETTKREAELWGLSIETQINDGTYKKPEKKKNYTVAQAIEKYLSDGNPQKDKKTRNEHMLSLNWFKKEIGHLPIKTLERSDIKKCRDKLKTKHKLVPIKGKKGEGKETSEFISNSCINRYLAYFSTFLTYCVNEYEIINHNPMIGAKLKLKENEPRKRWLKELKERQLLLELCKKHSYDLYLCALLALVAGARKSEVLNLQWKNADLENKAIYFLNTKNGEDRTIPIPDVLFEELKFFKENQKVIGIKNDYVFKSKTGEPNDNLIAKIFPNNVQKWSRKYNYEPITYHGLRHTYISIGALLGINTTIIKKIVGHKMNSVTGAYTHADCESLRQPMNLIANYMLYGNETKQQQKSSI